MKKVLMIKNNDHMHWVGDGFPVKTIFNYNNLGSEMSPFLMMDYAGPEDFSPSDHRRGVGVHPHRGFETVTIVYSGEVEHRDSSGGGGVIGPGDVQWMTAASGVVHDEFHSENFSRTGGVFEMIQLWVNLPKAYKMSTPRYQSLMSNLIPQVELDGGRLRVIAGEFNEVRGPAKTFSRVDLWDMFLNEESKLSFSLPENHTASLFVLNGKIENHDGQKVHKNELAVFEWQGAKIQFKALENSKILFMGGSPIDEPIVGHGPFVMNSIEEIREAYVDFQNGKMNHLPPP